MTDDHPVLPPDAHFGLLVVTLSLGIALYAGYQGAMTSAAAAIAATASAGCVTLFRPAWWGPWNRGWMRLGLALGMVSNTVALTTIYFLLITPVAVLTRLAGRDELRLRQQNTGHGYWIPRREAPASLKNFRKQF